MEASNLLYIVFKIMVIRMLKELGENYNSTKRNIETIKKDQLERKNSISDINNNNKKKTKSLSITLYSIFITLITITNYLLFLFLYFFLVYHPYSRTVLSDTIASCHIWLCKYNKLKLKKKNIYWKE